MHTTRKTRKIEHITKTSAHKHNHLRKEVRWGRNHWPIDAHKCRSTHQLYNVSTRGTQEKYDKRHSTIYSRENKLDIAQPMSLTGWLLGCQSALICQSYIFLKSLFYRIWNHKAPHSHPNNSRVCIMNTETPFHCPGWHQQVLIATNTMIISHNKPSHPWFNPRLHVQSAAPT